MSSTSNASPIVTLTPAPTLDRTYYISNFVERGVNRADHVTEELAGKGINVTQGLFVGGINAPGVVPVGNADPGVLARTGYSEKLIPLWVEGTLRVSTTIVIENGTTTRVTEGPRALSDDDWNAVIDLTEATVRDRGAKWLAIGGALPINKSTGEFVDLTPIFDRMDALGVKVAIDTSGAPLSYLARSGRPTIIKPNAEELASAVGRTLHTVGDVIDAARELCDHGIGAVLASMGVDGIMAVTKKSIIGAKTERVKVVNTVGAGDATLAGFLSAVATSPVGNGPEVYGTDFDIETGIKTAVRWGAVKVTQPSSGLSSVENLPESFFTETPDRDKPLEEPAIAH